MFYLRKKKYRGADLVKTYCEVVEKGSSLRRKTKSNPKHFLYLTIAGLMLFSANHCSAWDGAGDTWTCGKCGKSNYTWQNSCTNCGKS